MSRTPAWPPRVHLHKTGQARVRIDGVDHYLGTYGSPEASQAYAELVKRIEAERAGTVARVLSAKPTVADIADAYLNEQEGIRKDPDGKPTHELDSIKRAIQTMLHALGTELAADIAPRHFKAMRKLFIDGYKHPIFGKRRSNTRKSTNQNFCRCRAVFHWAAEEGLIPPSVYHGLALIRGLRPGDAGLEENPDVSPVPEDDLAKTLPMLGPIIRQMVDVQLLSACRPGEVCRLCPCEIGRTGDVWTWKPRRHKTAWRGHSKTIMLGPGAQAVLLPFLDRAPDKPCFSPREALLAIGRDWRLRTDCMAPTERYYVSSYDQAIRRACTRAGVPRWSANQLRHNAATRIEEEFGLEVARIVLGHRHLQTTKIYAQDNIAKAKAAMRKSG